MILLFHYVMIAFCMLSISEYFLEKYLVLRKNKNKKNCSSTYNDCWYECIGFLSCMSNILFIPFMFLLTIFCFANWPIFYSIILLTYLCFGLIVAAIGREKFINLVDDAIQKDDFLYSLLYITLIISNIFNPLWFIIDTVIKKFFNILITNNIFYKTYKNKKKG